MTDAQPAAVVTREEYQKLLQNQTPNKIVSNPQVRFWANILIGTAAIVLGFITSIDGASDAFDWREFTYPATVGILYLAGIFNVAVTAPNVPR
jgi:hypothetical protein